MQCHSLPYTAEVSRYFQAIKHLPWVCWLDGGLFAVDKHRFDVLTADPFRLLQYKNGQTFVTDRSGHSETPTAPPLDVLRDLLGNQSAAVADLPFPGGAIGYFSYDFGVELELGTPQQTADFPGIAMGVYDWALCIDHHKQQASLVVQGRDPDGSMSTAALLEALKTAVKQQAESIPEPIVLDKPVANMSRADYGKAFRKIQQYLLDGDCYQVNFAQSFKLPFTGDAGQLYQQMRAQNPAPYGAFLDFPFAQILSASPEQFLGLHNGKVVTRPIKGTRPRSANPVIDADLLVALQQSAKDRAENLMIVDLLRNDLGRVCKPGSIQVPELFKVESFPTVHHLVSTITGELAAGEDALSLLAASFPGGSITGAPKHRAMQIIQELEPEPRQVYCGAIGWIGFDGNMQTNIAIRTLLIQEGEAKYWAGGGIVADSEEAAEYQESLDKAAAFFALTEGAD